MLLPTMSNSVHFTQLPSELKCISDGEQKRILEKELQCDEDIQNISDSETASEDELDLNSKTGASVKSSNKTQTKPSTSKTSKTTIPKTKRTSTTARQLPPAKKRRAAASKREASPVPKVQPTTLKTSSLSAPRRMMGIPCHSLWTILTGLSMPFLIDYVDPLYKELQSLKDQPAHKYHQLIHMFQEVVEKVQSQITRNFNGKTSLAELKSTLTDPDWFTTRYDIWTMMNARRFLESLFSTAETQEFIQELQREGVSSALPPTQTPTSKTPATCTSSTTATGQAETVNAAPSQSTNVTMSFADLVGPTDLPAGTSNVSSNISLRVDTRLTTFKSAPRPGDILVDLRVYPLDLINTQDPREWWKSATF